MHEASACYSSWESRYVSSGWCEKELQLFVEIFGEQAIKTRLFIAAMSEAALSEARKKERWIKLFGDEQIWIAMYDEGDTNKPLPHVPYKKHYPQAFFDKVKDIANPLIARIEQDFKRSEDSVGAQEIVLIPPGAVADDEKQNVIRIGIGPYTDDLDGTAQALKAMLSRKGVEIDMLSRDLLSNYDPDSLDSPLRKALLSVDFLVVPVSDATPLLATTPGGHTAFLEEARAGLSNPPRIVWYRPDNFKVSIDKRALDKHLEKFSQLAPLCVSEQAVANELFGAGAGKGLKIYIEDDFSESDDTPVPSTRTRTRACVGIASSGPATPAAQLRSSRLATDTKRGQGRSRGGAALAGRTQECRFTPSPDQCGSAAPAQGRRGLSRMRRAHFLAPTAVRSQT